MLERDTSALSCRLTSHTYTACSILVPGVIPVHPVGVLDGPRLHVLVSMSERDRRQQT